MRRLAAAVSCLVALAAHEARAEGVPYTLTRTLEGHEGGVSQVAWSPDGTLVAASSYDKTISVWRAADGTRVHTLRGHEMGAFFVLFTADGRHLLTGSGKDIAVWDVATGARLRVLSQSGSLGALAVSPDGAHFAAAVERSVHIFEAEKWRLVRSFTRHAFAVHAIAFSPDGKTAVSGGQDWVVRLWDTATGREQYALGRHADSVSALAYSPDGHTVVSGAHDKTVHLWEAATGKTRWTVPSGASGPDGLAWSPDGKLVGFTRSNDVPLLDAATGKELAVLHGHTDSVRSLAWSRDGRLATGGSDRTIRLWDRPTAPPAGPGHLPAAEPAPIVSAAPVSLGPWVHDETRTLKGHSRAVGEVAFSPDGSHVAAASRDQTASVWRTTDGARLHVLKGHGQAGVASVAWSPDGRLLATGGYDSNVVVWDASTGKRLTGFAPGDVPARLAFVGDGSLLGVAAGNAVQLRDTRTWEAVRAFRGHTSGVLDFAFSPDGKTVVSGGADGVRLWDVATATQQHVFDEIEGVVCSVAFAPDGQRIFSGSGDQAIRVWDVATRKLARSIDTQPDGPWRLIVSPDGELVGTALEGELNIFQVATGSVHQVLSGHGGETVAYAFSADGRLLATSGKDRTIKLWVRGAATPTAPARRPRLRPLRRRRWPRWRRPRWPRSSPSTSRPSSSSAPSRSGVSRFASA